jgi:branched-chain amino acid transport system permease protein
MLPFLLTSGLTTGALYGLVALGLVVVHRSTGHINFAHGDLCMMGGFFAYSFIVYLQFPYFLSLVLAVICSFALGVLSDRLVFRRLIQAEGLTVVLGTVGLSYVLRGVSRYFWGGQGQYMSVPPIIDPAPIFVWGLPVLPQQLIVLGGALALMAGFAVFFKFSSMGRMMQAVSENTTAAYLVGIRVKRVFTWTWGCGAAVAGAAAVLMAPLTLLTPDMGTNLLLKAFAATVLGGLGSMPGAVVGGLLLGVSESLAGGYIDTGLQDVSSFIVIMLVLVVRPTGLFGAHRVRRF